MKKLFLLVSFFGAFFLPSLASGADGDPCVGHDSIEITKWTKGPWIPLACVQLCDGKVAADDTNDCTEYDFANAPGMPDIVVIEYQEDTHSSCSAGPDITITTGPITGGGFGTADAPEYSPDTTAVVLNATTDRILIVTELAHLDRFLFAELNDMTGCDEEGMDVRMFLYARKNRL